MVERKVFPAIGTGKIAQADFAIMLKFANGEIVRFQMLEDSFAVSQAVLERNIKIKIRTQRRR